MISNNRHFPNILPNLRQHPLLQETPPLSTENVRISVNMFIIMLVDSNSWYYIIFQHFEFKALVLNNPGTK